MEQVKRHFEEVLRRKGVALTGTQLLQFAEERKLGRLDRREVYRYLREEAPAVGKFARRDKVPATQGFSVFRPGVYFIDYGEYKKDWAGSNGGATGFLVAVENLTNRLFVLPTRGKDTEQWLRSIEKFVELTRQVALVYSDRDSVAQSAKFREKLERQYGIRWYFLKKGNKSYLAERYIGFVKTKLSQALESRPDGTRRWVDFVAPLVEEYNKQKVPGTSYRRQAVNRDNFSHFLAQAFKTPDYDLRFSSFAANEFANPAWNRAAFKFDLGDRVRVSRKADWTDPENRKGFKRVAALGGFGSKIYPVVGRQLRANAARTLYVPVYKLGGIRDGGFVFYEKELVAAAGAGAATPQND